MEVDHEVRERQQLLASGERAAEPEAHSENSLPWVPYRGELLTQHFNEQNTVLVDFTADW